MRRHVLREAHVGARRPVGIRLDPDGGGCPGRAGARPPAIAGRSATAHNLTGEDRTQAEVDRVPGLRFLDQAPGVAALREVRCGISGDRMPWNSCNERRQLVRFVDDPHPDRLPAATDPDGLRPRIAKPSRRVRERAAVPKRAAGPRSPRSIPAFSDSPSQAARKLDGILADAHRGVLDCKWQGQRS